MITLNVIDDNIVGSYGETPFSVPFSKEAYEQMQKLEEKAADCASVKALSKVYEKFAECIAEQSSAAMSEKFENIYVDGKTGKYYLKVGKVISKAAMPQALVERIELSLDKGIDITPLIKFWTRWLRNPILHAKTKAGKGELFSQKMFDFLNMKYVNPTLKQQFMDNDGYSEEKAAERATMYQIKITKEGLLNGFKVSQEVEHKYLADGDEDNNPKRVNRYKRTFNVDTGEIESDGKPDTVEERLFQPAVMGTSGDAFYCEGPNGFKEPGHFIRVGCRHYLPSWDMVDTNDDHSCVKGLHVGGLYYINYYSGEIHNVFIDPMHIGAVPDSRDGAIRCKEYFVHSSLAGVNGSIYNSSTYASMTDKEWATVREEAVQALNEKIEALKAEQDQFEI